MIFYTSSHLCHQGAVAYKNIKWHACLQRTDMIDAGTLWNLLLTFKQYQYNKG